MGLDPALLEFRPLAVADLPSLQTWFEAPHARRWFGNRSAAVEYTPYIDDGGPGHAYFVSYAGKPLGMICWMRLGDFPEVLELYGVEDPDTVNCDVVIGELEFLHRGLGGPLVRRFLREIVFADPTLATCVIDPELDNAAAHRAYTKAGFRHLRDVPDDGEGKPLRLMEMRRGDPSSD